MTDLLDDILPLPAPKNAAQIVLEHKNYWMDRALKAEAELEALRAARTSPNGQGYEVACFGCGTKFKVKRRPVPGRHQWCENCRASGEPAAQRARDYRTRKAESKPA